MRNWNFLTIKFRKDIAIFSQIFEFLNKNLQKHSQFSKKKAKKLKDDSKGAVRIDVRVKISWHPHPAYPPLSTLKARLFAFTHTLRGIDPY
jgi:hypothetical protein